MRQTNKLTAPLLFGAAAAAIMLAGATVGRAQDWHHGNDNGGYNHRYGGGYHNHYGGGYYDRDGVWHRRVFVEPEPTYVYPRRVYHYRHFSDYGHRRYYTYNGDRYYLDLDTGVRIKL